MGLETGVSGWKNPRITYNLRFLYAYKNPNISHLNILYGSIFVPWHDLMEHSGLRLSAQNRSLSNSDLDFSITIFHNFHRISQGDLVLQEGWYYPPTLALLSFHSLVSTENASKIWTSFNVVGMIWLFQLGYTILSSQPGLRYHDSLTLVSTSFPVLVDQMGIPLWLTVLCWYALDTSKESSPLGAGIARMVKTTNFLFAFC